MIIDAHLNTTGVETVADVLGSLDDAGVDVGVLLAPFLTNEHRLDDEDSLRRGNRFLADLVKGHEDRLVGLAVVNPRFDRAADDLRHAIEDLHLTGLKLVPSGWYPYDDCAHKVYEVASEYTLPVLFHTGIFIDGRSGRYCRPAFFEAVRDHPGMRVVLAHLGWPWCDEAIAVGLIDRINGVAADRCQIRFDLSFGPPPAYRHEVIGRALDVLGADLLQFGSDRFFPCSGAHIRAGFDEFDAVLDALGTPAADRERMLCGTAANWLGLSTRGTTSPPPVPAIEAVR